jgi:uncharacterized Zn finger protein
MVCSLLVEEYCAQRSLDQYKKVRESATRLGLWEIVRKNLLHYLETGILPWNNKGGNWPMELTGLVHFEKDTYFRPPFTNDLIEIALLEKRTKDVLFWYEKAGSRYHGHPSDIIAEALKMEYPDKAIAIWKDIVDEHTMVANVRQYPEAVEYLEKIKEFLTLKKRDQEWAPYLAEFRARHKAKKRLMELVDGMEGERRRIIDT